LITAANIFDRIGNVTSATYEGQIRTGGIMSYIICLDNIKDNMYSISILDKTIKKIDNMQYDDKRKSYSIEILKNENNGVLVIYVNANVIENEEIKVLESQIQVLKLQVQTLAIETQLRKEMITALFTQLNLLKSSLLW